MRLLVLQRNWSGSFCCLRHLYRQQYDGVKASDVEKFCISRPSSVVRWFGIQQPGLGGVICGRSFSTAQGRYLSRAEQGGKVVLDHTGIGADVDVFTKSHITEEVSSHDTEEVGGHDTEEAGGHVPVMTKEVLERLEHCGDKKVFVDMTFGGGGHSRSIIQNFPQCRVIALDRDPLAHQLAQKLASQSSPEQILPLLGKFSDMPALTSTRGITPGSIDGILFDLGSSSMQFDEGQRGFSLSKNGPLDMRMDADRDPSQVTAADVVNLLDESDLVRILKKYGDEKMARKITHAIVEARSAFGRITTTHQLADIVQSVFPTHWSSRKDKLYRHAHVATKTFQALRIFVNNELNELNSGLVFAHHYLKVGGVCVAISFHGLEDRIVKRHFHHIDLDEKNNMNIHDRFRNRNSIVSYSQAEIEEVMRKKWTPLSKRITVPSELEVTQNARCRSAKLRAAIKC